MQLLRARPQLSPSAPVNDESQLDLVHMTNSCQRMLRELSHFGGAPQGGALTLDRQDEADSQCVV
jgi:hypothetical protein